MLLNFNQLTSAATGVASHPVAASPVPPPAPTDPVVSFGRVAQLRGTTLHATVGLSTDPFLSDDPLDRGIVDESGVPIFEG